MQFETKGHVGEEVIRGQKSSEQRMPVRNLWSEWEWWREGLITFKTSPIRKKQSLWDGTKAGSKLPDLKHCLLTVHTASPSFTLAATQQRAYTSSHFSSQVCVCMCVHIYYISSSACCSRTTVLGQKHKRWNISQCLRQLRVGFLHLCQSMWLFLCAPCSCISRKAVLIEDNLTGRLWEVVPQFLGGI